MFTTVGTKLHQHGALLGLFPEPAVTIVLAFQRSIYGTVAPKDHPIPIATYGEHLVPSPRSRSSCSSPCCCSWVRWWFSAGSRATSPRSCAARLQTAIDIQDVSKRFRLYKEKYTSLKERILHAGHVPHEDFWALRDVGFEVKTGETFGIIGRNGSGKSTLLKCIAGILQPTSGQIVVRGHLAAMLELGAGFQPELSGRDNIYLNASLLGLSRRDIARRLTRSSRSRSWRSSSTTRFGSTPRECTYASASRSR